MAVARPDASDRRSVPGRGSPSRVSGVSSRNVLAILFAFDERRPQATVAELAQLVDVPLPTAYRHIALLKDLRLLEEGPAGRYHPTARVMPLARAAQLSNDLAQVARPIVVRAMEEIGETVMLMQYVGDEVVCIELAECAHSMRYTFQKGHAVPAGVGASGKMALACLPRGELARYLGGGAPGDLASDVESARAERSASSLSEFNEGVWACSAPVTWDVPDPVVLTAAGPASRLDAPARDAASQVISAAAREIAEVYRRFRL